MKRAPLEARGGAPALHRAPGCARAWLAAALAATFAAGCATPAERKDAAVYGPTESVLELVAVLRRHVADDTYRFPPATDFTGRNVYRATLIRLENLERVHAETLRAGHMDGVVAFSKARAMERLRAYDLAAQHYRLAGQRDELLRADAERSAAFCERLHAAVQLGIDLVDPLASAGAAPMPADPESVAAGLEERTAALDALRGRTPAAHYEPLVLQEIERADVTRARYFTTMRFALPDGHVRAVGEWQRTVTRHGASQLYLRHLLELADLYEALARDYVEAIPPESLRFDPPKFQELTEAAAQIYRRVASEDGTPEKLEAARNLEAFLAFTLRVDRDRFAQ